MAKLLFIAVALLIGAVLTHRIKWIEYTRNYTDFPDDEEGPGVILVPITIGTVEIFVSMITPLILLHLAGFPLSSGAGVLSIFSFFVGSFTALFFWSWGEKLIEALPEDTEGSWLPLFALVFSAALGSVGMFYGFSYLLEYMLET